MLKNNKKLRILIVAFSDSIHVARWIEQIIDQNWEIHLFSSIDSGIIHSSLKNVKVYHSIYTKQKNKVTSVKVNGLAVHNEDLALLGRKILQKYMPKYRIIHLKNLIKKIKPDIIHSIEIQHSGYLILGVKKIFSGQFPPWIVTNWGSDIYLFGQLKEHQSKIREVLSHCDYYSCECQRDAVLARKFGFKGRLLPIFPNTGGFDIDTISQFRQVGLTSKRRIIALKGYQHWAGRALVGLRALERCSDLLKGYTVMIYSAFPEVEISAELFSQSTGIPTFIIPFDSSHEDILRLHGQARISIGLSISDAISTSLLEAIVMGSFPIQSWTSCANEWIRDGETGILVPPEDPEIIEQAIRKALTNDELVNLAAELNYCLVRTKLDKTILKSKTIDFYESVIKNIKR